MEQRELKQLEEFFAQTDSDGVSNLEKASAGRTIRRIASTSKDKSYEAAEDSGIGMEYPRGVVVVDGRLVGFGIHILNEDVYPLQSFEIYLRGCGLTGELNLSGCRDMVFLDIYNNAVTAVKAADMPSMRIFGIQSNLIEELDVSALPACQGIDAGKNRLKALDVSANSELVELYINDNDMSEINLSANKKLKYFYCQNNHITSLDTTANPLLRHCNASGNPMKTIRSLAPQREDRLPLTITAGDGGCVGLCYKPIYNAQWKETGEWQQTYYAYPDSGKAFAGWFDANGILVSDAAEWNDEYGASREITARFI